MAVKPGRAKGDFPSRLSPRPTHPTEKEQRLSETYAMIQQPGDDAAEAGPDVVPFPVVLDLEILAELAELDQGGEPGLLQSLLDGFRQTGPVELARIRDAVAHEDAGLLWRTAHRFKGTAGNLGARAVAECCHALEVLGRSRTVEGGNGLADKLEAEYNQAIALLFELETKGSWTRKSPMPPPEAPS
jgi:HPt (histidine-containing phosphotransfer) domain-containing protein